MTEQRKPPGVDELDQCTAIRTEEKVVGTVGVIDNKKRESWLYRIGYEEGRLTAKAERDAARAELAALTNSPTPASPAETTWPTAEEFGNAVFMPEISTINGRQLPGDALVSIRLDMVERVYKLLGALSPRQPVTATAGQGSAGKSEPSRAKVYSVMKRWGNGLDGMETAGAIINLFKASK